MEYLASADAHARWPDRGKLTAHRYVQKAYGEGNAVLDELDAKLTGHDLLCFDASDTMPPAMQVAFYQAVIDTLADPAGLGRVLARLDKTREKQKQRGAWLRLSCGR